MEHLTPNTYLRKNGPGDYILQVLIPLEAGMDFEQPVHTPDGGIYNIEFPLIGDRDDSDDEGRVECYTFHLNPEADEREIEITITMEGETKGKTRLRFLDADG